MIKGYIRVSTAQQKGDRQWDELMQRAFRPKIFTQISRAARTLTERNIRNCFCRSAGAMCLL